MSETAPLTVRSLLAKCRASDAEIARLRAEVARLKQEVAYLCGPAYRVSRTTPIQGT